MQYEFWPCIQIAICKYKAFRCYSPGIAAVVRILPICHKQLNKALCLDNKEMDSKPVKLEHRSCM